MIYEQLRFYNSRWDRWQNLLRTFPAIRRGVRNEHLLRQSCPPSLSDQAIAELAGSCLRRDHADPLIAALLPSLIPVITRVVRDILAGGDLGR